MTVKEYLEQPHEAERKAIRCMEQVREVRATTNSVAISYTSVRVQSSRQQSRVEAGVIKAMELEAQALDLLSDYVRSFREVRALIVQVPDTDHSFLLELRYLNFKTWNEIAKIMGKTSRWVQILHSRALAVAQAIFEGSANCDRK